MVPWAQSPDWEWFEGWPLNAKMEEPTEDDAVCISHIRWFGPCLTSETRYDSKNLDCMVVRDHFVSEVLRRFHDGRITREEVKVLFREALSHGVRVERVKNPKGKIS